jgi:hypothetical protein
MSGQEIIAGAIVFLAVVYTIRRLWRIIRGDACCHCRGPANKIKRPQACRKNADPASRCSKNDAGAV